MDKQEASSKHQLRWVCDSKTDGSYKNTEQSCPTQFWEVRSQNMIGIPDESEGMG